MLRLFHIVLVLGNRVKILKLPLYSIQFLHQITTTSKTTSSSISLYSIQFLHQITTEHQHVWIEKELYSIQFLHQITTLYNDIGYQDVLYSIQFLHQITTSCSPRMLSSGCIVSNFYIKSQQYVGFQYKRFRCIVSNFYIKSQPQALHLLIIRVLHPYVPRKKRCSAN